MMAVRKLCLLVDDDLDDHEIFSLALQDTRHYVDVIRAYDGVEAINFLRNPDEDLPDFIFLDLNMPRMNGAQCLAEIRKYEDLKHIPVIIYSTSSEIKDLIEAQQLGASAYIVKSSNILDLTLALKDFFKDNFAQKA